MNEALNKNSTVVQSLIDYALDIKPYHSKITEAVVEYRFEDLVRVRIRELDRKRMLHRSTHVASYFSGGVGSPRNIELHSVDAPGYGRVEAPFETVAQPGWAKVGRDGFGDLIGLPVYSKQSFDGTGVNDLILHRGQFQLPLQEGHDFFQVDGAFEFRISQIDNASGNFQPLWQDTRLEGIVSAARNATITSSTDGTIGSALNRVQNILAQIEAHLVMFPNAAATVQLNALLAQTAAYQLPSSYQLLWDELGGTPVMPGYTDWVGEDTFTDKFVSAALSSHSPPLYFGQFSDMGQRQNGLPQYLDASVPAMISVTNVVAVAGTGERWTIRCINQSTNSWQVVGDNLGEVGTFQAGFPFTSQFIQFDTTVLGGPLLDTELVLKPTRPLVVGEDASTEVWQIVKVNRPNHSRSFFLSTRFGYIEAPGNILGTVQVLDGSFPDCTVTLTAVSPTLFELRSSAEPSYTALAQVGVPYNDGRLAFTIRQGSVHPFFVNDRFHLNIVNPEPKAVGLDLFYGYDLDPYRGWDDGDTNTMELVYNNTDPLHPDYNRPIDFGYNSRFTDYALTNFDLKMQQNVVHNRIFKVVANADGAPVATLKRDGTGPFHWVDFGAEAGDGAPLNAPPPPVVASTYGSPDPDIYLNYSQSFQLKYSDDDGATWTPVADGSSIATGATYTSAVLGIEFTLAAGSKPFIASTCEDPSGGPAPITGGDVFWWRVDNPGPRVEPAPATLTSPLIPRLILRSEGFFSTVDADWTLQFIDSQQWTLSGTYRGGPLNGQPVVGYPISGKLPIDSSYFYSGSSLDDALQHWTVKQGLGLGNGDRFTFRTFADQYDFLVHGSVSGWQKPASVGQWYWNGKIGFQFDQSSVSTFALTLGSLIDSETNTVPDVSVSLVDPLAESATYRFVKQPYGGWAVNSATGDLVGYASTSFIDTSISVTIGAGAPDMFIVFVKSGLDAFVRAKNTVVPHSEVPHLKAGDGDFLAAAKSVYGKVYLNLDYTTVDTPPVTPELELRSIDGRALNTDTGSTAFPIQRYSPEAVITTNFVPLRLEFMDAVEQPAHFDGLAPRVKVFSRTTGQVIGSIEPIEPLNLTGKKQFVFDEVFATEYLPLNAGSNIIVSNPSLNERVAVKMADHVMFLISGGGLTEDALFTDEMNVSMLDQIGMLIEMSQQDSVNVNLDDGPFEGFLPGYSNMPYDAEQALGLDLAALTAARGQYDTGELLVDSYLRAQYLNTIPARSAAEDDALLERLTIIADYLEPGGLDFTSLPEFVANIGGTQVQPGFGIPKKGAAINTRKNDSDANIGVSFGESFASVSTVSSAGYDSARYDIGLLDDYTDTLATFTTDLLPPFVAAATYENTVTPFETVIPANSFLLQFNSAPANMPVPSVQVWVQGTAAPVQVFGVQAVSNGIFAFSISQPAIVKVLVS